MLDRAARHHKDSSGQPAPPAGHGGLQPLPLPLPAPQGPRQGWGGRGGGGRCLGRLGQGGGAGGSQAKGDQVKSHEKATKEKRSSGAGGEAKASKRSKLRPPASPARLVARPLHLEPEYQAMLRDLSSTGPDPALGIPELGAAVLARVPGRGWGRAILLGQEGTGFRIFICDLGLEAVVPAQSCAPCSPCSPSTAGCPGSPSPSPWPGCGRPAAAAGPSLPSRRRTRCWAAARWSRGW